MPPSAQARPVRFAIVGGGLVGLATALELKRLRPDSEVRLIEKEVRVGMHQSTHNSGVLHAGLYYQPGSLKARLSVEGIRKMVQFCRENGVAHDVCGKVVVASDEAGVARLKKLHERGNQNGLRDLRLLSPSELREIEPHAGGLAALHVPEEGIVDYPGVCAALSAKLTSAEVAIVTSAQLIRAVPDSGAWRLETKAGDFACDFLISCAGLHSDRVARSAGERPTTRIVPFRGDYYKLKPSAQHLVRNLIYPVPDPVFPFLGVHFTRLIGGGIEAGPNAAPAFAREGYLKSTIDLTDLFDIASFPGFWRFVIRHRSMAWAELRRSFSRRKFCDALRRLVPELQESDLEPGGSGIRAQAMQPDGVLVQDFQILERPNALHVLNAPSPAATASLAIGEYVAARALSQS